ncbi:pleckstrin homology domain-containing family A member 3-like [Petromyzon marinus]|uniref:Pleckstrin homology domain-containing family A member 3-like n=1 Tax=Petromyzon marinus TaxID=7757 RepID=A0AAJ7WLM8_PETMA|nr:pleckstrin homology domain-containing family A member 3-like [Petromyzon marinus]
MEGSLYKWTNYLSGWQPRWFVLDGGILSYYDSQDDVSKGCKGSIKMAVCEIQVHSSDGTRLDLVIPGEQHFYLRAMNAAERQSWLVALGSSKACLHDSRSKKEKEISETSDFLKTKMSELRLYSDLIKQQINTVRESLQPGESRTRPDMEKMNEASSLLDATCGTFLKTLEECMIIANSSFKPELFHFSPPPSPVSPVSPASAPFHINRIKRTSQPNFGSLERHATQTWRMDSKQQHQQHGGTTVVRDLEEMASIRSLRRLQRQRSPSQTDAEQHLRAATTAPEGQNSISATAPSEMDSVQCSAERAEEESEDSPSPHDFKDANGDLNGSHVISEQALPQPDTPVGV